MPCSKKEDCNCLENGKVPVRKKGPADKGGCVNWIIENHVPKSKIKLKKINNPKRPKN